MDIFETKYCCTLVSENAVRLFSESVALVFSVHTHIGNVAVNGTVNGKFTESGQAFEKAAYGKGVETYNAKDVWRSKQPDLQPLIAPLIPLLNVTR